MVGAEELNIVPAQKMYESFDPPRDSGEDLEKIAGKCKEMIDDGVIDYISAYHRTSHRLRDEIQEHGLLPRDASGMVSRDGGSHADRVYFTVEDGGYPSAGRGTVKFIGGREMSVKAILEPDNLVADEDSNYRDPIKGILADGVFGYAGPIAPERENPRAESWIEEFEISGKVIMPQATFVSLPDTKEEIDEERLVNTYNSQLTAFEACWLMSYNKLRSDKGGAEDERITGFSEYQVNPFHRFEDTQRGTDLFKAMKPEPDEFDL